MARGEPGTVQAGVRETLKPRHRLSERVPPALEPLAVPAPITADEDETGPAALAMAAAALDGTEPEAVVDRVEPTRSSVELAREALGLGYHVRLCTPDPDAVTDRAREAGLLVHPRAGAADVARALDARNPVIVSGPDDGPPFLLVLREDEDELVVDDPSVDERPLTWTWDRLEELLVTDPAPRVIELAPRTRMDR